MTKVCVTCEAIKPLDAFHVQPLLRDGRRRQCKECDNDVRRRRRANPEGRRAELDRDNCSRRNPEYRERHRLSEQARRDADREAFHNYRRDYYARKLKSNRVVQTEEERQAKARAACKLHWENNRQYYRTKTLNYLARKRGADGSHTVAEFREVLIVQAFRCFYCGTDISNNATEDHFIPLSKGGSNYIDNIRGACLPCNRRKGNRLIHSSKMGGSN